MSPHVRAEMEEWLASGDDRKVHHARAVLGLSTPPPPGPTRLEMLRSFAGSMVAWARSGFRVAGRVERARRRMICRRCESYDPDADRCRRCGCFLILKGAVENARCPAGKW